MALARWLAVRRNVPATDSAATASVLDVIARVAYRGPAFQGWQRQSTAPAQQHRTVEGALMGAIAGAAGLAHAAVPLHALSRTDTDVSARDQLVRFRLPAAALAQRGLGPAELRAAVNATLQPLGATVARLRFARPSQVQLRDAVRAKVYSFYIGCGSPHSAVAHLRPCLVYCPQALDVRAMATALAATVGTHDFGAFTNADRRGIAARGGDGRNKRRGGGGGGVDAARASRRGDGGCAGSDGDDGDEDDGDGVDDDDVGSSNVGPLHARAVGGRLGGGATNDADALDGGGDAGREGAGGAPVSGAEGGSAADDGTPPLAHPSRFSRKPGGTVRAMLAACLTVLPPDAVHIDHAIAQSGGVLVEPLPPAAAAAGGGSGGGDSGVDAGEGADALGGPLKRPRAGAANEDYDSVAAAGGAPAAAVSPADAAPSSSSSSPPVPLPSARVVRITFVGDGFLRHQLRRLAGALLAIGRGELHASFVAEALATGLPCGGMTAVPPAASSGSGSGPDGGALVAHGSSSSSGGGSGGGAAVTAYASSRLRGGGIPYSVAPGRGLWLERLVLVDEPLPLSAASVLDGSVGTTAFWEDDDWCNNPTPGYCDEWGLHLVKELA